MDSCRAGDTLTPGPSLPVRVLTQGASFPARSSVPTAPAPWMLFKVTDRPPAVSGPGHPCQPKATWEVVSADPSHSTRKPFTRTSCLASCHPASYPRVARLHPPAPSWVLLCRPKGSAQPPQGCRPALRLYKVLLTGHLERLGISQNSVFPDTSTFRAQFFCLQNWG